MNSSLIRAVMVTLCCASLGAAGCSTTHRVDSSAEALARDKVAVGDKVKLHYVNGRSQHLKLTRIGDHALTGATNDGRTVEKQYAQIIFLEYKKVDARKMAGVALGVVAMTAVIVVSAVASTAVAVAAYQ